MVTGKGPEPRRSVEILSAVAVASVVTLISAVPAGVAYSVLSQHVARNAMLAGHWLLTPSVYRLLVPLLWGLPVALGLLAFWVTRDRRQPPPERWTGWR